MKRRLIRILIPLTLGTVALTAGAVALALHLGGGAVTVAGRALAACAAVAALSALTGVFLLRRVIKPLDPAGEDPGYDEYAPLFRLIGEQKRQLKVSRASLEEKERKISAITENMTEGLALLTVDGGIMFINRAAAALLGAEVGELDGGNLVALGADQRIQAAFHAAAGGHPDRETISMGELSIQVLANPVMVDGAARGVVLLLLDVTERAAAERMRREFSANVSHELKTPITSISGYAEMMMTGMAKSEDVPALSGKIYREAQRLIALINDIIRLSLLDEGEEQGPLEEVELFSAAASVCERLEPKARECSVTVEQTGSAARVAGDGRLIDELLANLVDNSIKYNRPGGHVWVETGSREGVPFLTVSDDGIGIANEHMGRVFERFYTVDRSRSRDTGGTGLGLSIVKHAAGYMRARVEAESVPNRGTRISVIFDGKGGQIG